MDAYRNVVVAVRGEDDLEPGEALRALAASLPGPPGSYQRSDLVLGHDLCPRLLNSAPTLPDLIEVEGTQAGHPPRAWCGRLRRLLGLIMGLPAVRFDWCEAAPAVHTRQAYRDVVESTFLWSLWPVGLTLAHTVLAPAARPNLLLLEVLLMGLLALLARSQWRSSCRVTVAGYVWLGLCLGLTLVLWSAPRWTALATSLSIRVYGLAQLATAVAFLAMVAEVVSRIARGLISRRRGLAGLSLAVLPWAFSSLFGVCVWTLVLNALLAVGSPPVLEAYKGWQQTFTKALGYHLASVEWAVATITALAAVLALCACWHRAQTRQGETARRWLAGIAVVLVLGFALLSLYMLLTSPYLGAPLARLTQRLGTITDVTSLYTWSALRVVPCLLLLWLSPAWQVLKALGEMGFYLMPPDDSSLSSRPASRERLAQLLRFLDRGCYDRIHVIAHGQGSVIALDVLRKAELHHPLALTTCGSPAGTLYRDLLDWPSPGAGTAEWRNLFYQDDPSGGPVGIEGVDAPLQAGGRSDYWSDALLADRVIQVMRAPLPPPRP
jgi:hypothetical protein